MPGFVCVRLHCNVMGTPAQSQDGAMLPTLITSSAVEAVDSTTCAVSVRCTMARLTKTTMASPRAMANPICKIRTCFDFERIEFRAIAVNLSAVFLSKIQIMVEPLIQKERKGLITYKSKKNSSDSNCDSRR